VSVLNADKEASTGQLRRGHSWYYRPMDACCDRRDVDNDGGDEGVGRLVQLNIVPG